jgi:GDP-L-fucose synthase
MAQDKSALRIYVAGHTGMVGSAIYRRLERAGYSVIKPLTRVDLCDQQLVLKLFSDLKPDWVFLAAARVGGIHANSIFPAQFIYQNLMIQTNVIHAAYLNGVKKLLFLGSSCIYPRIVPQPIKEEYLLSGYLEPTNKAYSVAKIAGIVMCQSYSKEYGANFISVMPTNLYGPNDNFDLKNSHVVPALLRKTHEAHEAGADFVEIWGSGNPRREFLHVDDVADACLFLMERYDSPEIINIGSGVDISIHDLALLIKDIVGFKGGIRFNSDMPDGMPQKLLDVSHISALGWKPRLSLLQGLESTYQWFLLNRHKLRKS